MSQTVSNTLTYLARTFHGSFGRMLLISWMLDLIKDHTPTRGLPPVQQYEPSWLGTRYHVQIAA